MTNPSDLIRRGDAEKVAKSLFRLQTTGLYGAMGVKEYGVLTEVASKAIAAVAASQPANPVINADSRQRVTVKPLVWEEQDGKSYRQANCVLGQYQVRFLCEFECWQLSRFVRSGQVWKETFSRHSNKDAAKAAAQADYEARILAALDVQPYPRELTVWYGKMPESNGRENWTATLRPKYAVTGVDLNGLMDGFCFARSEFPDRVRYEADRMRWIIGELTEKPHILAYDADLHSGYVPPPDPRDAQIERLVEAVKALEMWDAARGYPVPYRVRDPLRAALAAVKGGDA